MADNWDHGYRRAGERGAVEAPKGPHGFPVTGMTVEFVEAGYPTEFAAAIGAGFVPGALYLVADFKLGGLRSEVRIVGHEAAGWLNSSMFKPAEPK